MSPSRIATFLATLALASTAAAATFTVNQASGRVFSPPGVVVQVGDTVQWRNADTMPHTSTSSTGLWDSGNMNPGQTYSYTFTTAGTYDYACTYHGGMNGRVVVVAGGAVVKQIAGRQFSPAVVHVATGETVVWQNADTMPHTSTSSGGLWDSGNMNAGDVFAYTFAAAGTYDYVCTYHSGMAGRVIVLDRAVTVRQVAPQSFSPQSVTVPVGGSVIWQNADAMPHTTTSGSGGTPDGKWDSTNMAPGATFAYTFAATGTYPYYCAYHLPGMNGTIQVGSVPPPSIEVRLTKKGLDVVLAWSGGTAPFTVERGQRKDGSDLATLHAVAVGSGDTDTGVVPLPPSFLVYGVK